MRRFYPALLIALVALAAVALTVAIYAAEIRDALVFQPAQRQAEAASRRIAAAEQAVFRKSGKVIPLTALDTAPGSEALGLDWHSMPSELFQFEARALPDRHLQLRALPQPDAVASLKVAPRMYVAELSTKGEFLRGGWYP
jgi:hypothetical protein